MLEASLSTKVLAYTCTCAQGAPLGEKGKLQLQKLLSFQFTGLFKFRILLQVQVWDAVNLIILPKRPKLETGLRTNLRSGL